MLTNPTYRVSPRPINVYIRDTTNTIIASGAYTSPGSYSFTFTPSSSNSDYTLEYYVTDASGLCYFTVDNISISSPSASYITVCDTLHAGDYRFGFQAQEKDDEVKGAGNSVNYTYRMHDPRLGRFFAIDPLAYKYPYYSPYAFSGNRVIDAVELEGLEPEAINPGIDYLFIVVLGYEGKEPPKGKTQNKNNPYSKSDYDEQIKKNGLTKIESHFQDRSDVKVVVFSSAKISGLTEADVIETMNLYVQNNPNGVIALIGHSLGATNVINAAESSNIPISFMYTIDIAPQLVRDYIAFLRWCAKPSAGARMFRVP